MPGRAEQDPASPAWRLPSPSCILPSASGHGQRGQSPDPTTHPSLTVPRACAQLPPLPVLTWVLQTPSPHLGYPVLQLLLLHPYGSCPNTFSSPDPHPLLLGSPNPIPVLQLLARSSLCSPAILSRPQDLEYPQNLPPPLVLQFILVALPRQVPLAWCHFPGTVLPGVGSLWP